MMLNVFVVFVGVCRMKNKNTRYFFVSYNSKSHNGFGFGSVDVRTNDGTFPSLKELENELISRNNLTGIAILNIQELNEQDFKDCFGISDVH